MLDDVKTALRVNTNNPQITQEIEDLIESARLDLVQSGVDSDIAMKDDDPLIKRAIIFYAKANFGLDNPNAERWNESFKLLKQHLSLAGDYNGRIVE